MLHTFLAMFQMTKREGKTICELGSRELSERESRGLSVIPTLVLALAVATVLRRKHVFRHPLLICGMREWIESSHSCCFNSAISVRGKETRDRILPAISPIHTVSASHRHPHHALTPPSTPAHPCLAAPCEMAISTIAQSSIALAPARPHKDIAASSQEAGFQYQF